MIDPNIVSAGDRFMEGSDHDRPAAAATTAGGSAMPMGRTPVTGICRGIEMMPDIYSCPTDEVLI
jgi:hypothetical protein